MNESKGWQGNDVVLERVLRLKLGNHGYRLLVARLKGAQKAFDTLADVAPALLDRLAREQMDWRAVFPTDVLPMLETLLARFDRDEVQSAPSTSKPAAASLRLVKGRANEKHAVKAAQGMAGPQRSLRLAEYPAPSSAEATRSRSQRVLRSGGPDRVSQRAKSRT